LGRKKKEKKVGRGMNEVCCIYEQACPGLYMGWAHTSRPLPIGLRVQRPLT
jgi:hypothetical protein